MVGITGEEEEPQRVVVHGRLRTKSRGAAKQRVCDRREYGDDLPLYDQGEHRDESYCVSERDMEGNEGIKSRQAGGAPNKEE